MAGIAVVVLILGAGACSREEIVVDGGRRADAAQAGSSTSPSGNASTGAGGAADSGDVTGEQVDRVIARLSAAPISGLGSAERRTLLAVGLRAAGLTAEEAGCITSDPQVGDDPTAASPVQGVPPEVLGKCVPGPRLSELASNPSLDLDAIDVTDLGAVITPAVRSALEASGLQPAEADCVAKAAAAKVDVVGLAGLLGGVGTVPPIDAATVTRCIGASRIAELAR